MDLYSLSNDKTPSEIKLDESRERWKAWSDLDWNGNMALPIADDFAVNPGLVLAVYGGARTAQYAGRTIKRGAKASINCLKWIKSSGAKKKVYGQRMWRDLHKTKYSIGETIETPLRFGFQSFKCIKILGFDDNDADGQGGESKKKAMNTCAELEQSYLQLSADVEKKYSEKSPSGFSFEI
ncbi:MAG: hypothetical protein CMO81_00610 [Waddliaceae bacterium]|nr:hypothetical protein [Waddliaceae bacterium]